MRCFATLVTLLSATAVASAEQPTRYLGVGVDLATGLAGGAEVGGSVRLAPLRHLELGVEMIRHQVEGNPFAGDSDSHGWLLSVVPRFKLPFEDYGAFVLGAGVMTGPHAVSEGGYCYSSGLINLCPGGMSYDDRSFQKWDRAWFARVEIGAEFSYGPVGARAWLAPAVMLNDADVVQMADDDATCQGCDASVVMFGISAYARFGL